MDKSSTSGHFYLPQNTFGDDFNQNLKNGKQCENVFDYVVAVLHQDGRCGFKNICVYLMEYIGNACEIHNLYLL